MRRFGFQSRGFAELRIKESELERDQGGEIREPVRGERRAGGLHCLGDEKRGSLDRVGCGMGRGDSEGRPEVAKGRQIWWGEAPELSGYVNGDSGFGKARAALYR